MRRLIQFAGLFLFGFSHFALAQEDNVIEEIVVTAQKRTESLQDVAGSISALGKNQIDMRGVTDIEDIYQSIPGLNYMYESGANLITIRGIGLFVDSGYNEPGVASHIDGIYQARATLPGVQTIDLERVEVLRGPQGTLYGRNATGGVVNFITAKPTEEFEGSFNVGFGDWDKVTASGYISGPIVQNKLLGRVSVSYSDHDGFIDNHVAGADSELGDEKIENIRAALRFLPSDNVTIDLSYNNSEIEYDQFQPRIDASDATTPQLTPPALGGVPAGAFIPAGPNETAQGPGFRGATQETESAALSIEWDINENLTFKSLTGYADHMDGPASYVSNTYIDAAGNPVFLSAAIGQPDDPRIVESDSWSQEFNLIGNYENWQWTVGFYHFEEDYFQTIPVYFLDLGPILGAGAFGPGISFDQFTLATTKDITSQAVFADVTYSISDTFRINAGLRYGEDEKETEQTQSITLGNNTPIDLGFLFGLPPGIWGPGSQFSIPACGAALGNGESDQDWDSTSPKLRFEWDAGDNFLVYAQWQEGFKGGGVNDGECDDRFDPEEITSYEVGFKSTLLDGTMILNGAVFVYDYEDLQVATLNEQGTSSIIVNIPGVDVVGGELEMLWNISDVVSTDIAVAISNGETSKTLIVGDTRRQIEGQPFILDIDGNTMPRNPEFTASLGVNLDFETDIGGLSFRGEIYHSDETQFRMFDNDADTGDSYTVANLYATLTTLDDKFTVRGYVKNVTDEEYLYNILHSSAAGGGGRWAPPRHWGIEATYRF